MRKRKSEGKCKLDFPKKKKKKNGTHWPRKICVTDVSHMKIIKELAMFPTNLSMLIMHDGSGGPIPLFSKREKKGCVMITISVQRLLYIYMLLPRGS